MLSSLSSGFQCSTTTEEPVDDTNTLDFQNLAMTSQTSKGSNDAILLGGGSNDNNNNNGDNNINDDSVIGGWFQCGGGTLPTTTTIGDYTMNGTTAKDRLLEDDDVIVDESQPLNCNYDENITYLYEMIEAKEWMKVYDFLTYKVKNKKKQQQQHDAGGTPKTQVRTWVCQYKDSGSVLFKCQLPIHLAIVNGAPYKIIERLIYLYPNCLKMKDDQYNLPIHLAFQQLTPVGVHHLHNSARSSVSSTSNNENIIYLLLKEYPESMHIRGGKDRKYPHECASQNIDSGSRHYLSEILSVYVSQAAANNKKISDNNKTIDNNNGSNSNNTTKSTTTKETNTVTDKKKMKQQQQQKDDNKDTTVNKQQPATAAGAFTSTFSHNDDAQQQAITTTQEDCRDDQPISSTNKNEQSSSRTTTSTTNDDDRREDSGSNNNNVNNNNKNKSSSSNNKNNKKEKKEKKQRKFSLFSRKSKRKHVEERPPSPYIIKEEVHAAAL